MSALRRSIALQRRDLIRHGLPAPHGVLHFIDKARPNAGCFVEPGFPKRDGKEGRLFAALSWNEGKSQAGPFLGRQVPCGDDQQREGVKVHPGSPCGIHSVG